MKPDAGVVLETTAAKLMFEMAPQMHPPFLQGTVTVIGLLLTMLREEWDRAAQRRVEENEILRRLFVRAAPHLADDHLRRGLLAAAESREAGLRIAELDAANDTLRGLLIELQAHVEDLQTPEARTLEAEIWQELVASTERRRFTISPF
jgi:hypothetical protein